MCINDSRSPALGVVADICTATILSSKMSNVDEEEIKCHVRGGTFQLLNLSSLYDFAGAQLAGFQKTTCNLLRDDDDRYVWYGAPS